MIYEKTSDTEEDKKQKAAFDYRIYISIQDQKLEIKNFVPEKQQLVLRYTSYIYFNKMAAFQDIQTK